MKTIRLILLWLYCLAYMAFADRVLTLSWDANPPDEMVTAYEVSVDGKLATTVSDPAAQLTIPDAKCSLSVVAVNSLGTKSDPSNPLVIPAAPSNPKGVKVVKIIRTITTISRP